MFPVLVTAVVGGLWITAASRAGEDDLMRESRSLAMPVQVEPRKQPSAEPALYIVADDGSSLDALGPT